MQATRMNLYSFERESQELSNESKIKRIESLVAEYMRSIYLFLMFNFDR